MGEQKSNGCTIAAVVVAVLAVGVLVGMGLVVRGCFSAVREVRAEVAEEAREAREHAREIGVEPEEGVLVLQKDELPRPEPHRKGEPLARETWLAWALDDKATQFARQAFREAADGSPVDWMLRTEDVVVSEGGDPEGSFGLPVRIESRVGNSRSSEGRTITVRAEFDRGSTERLMSVRRGDWVRVAGRLAVNGEEIAITHARIVLPGDGTPVEREAE